MHSVSEIKGFRATALECWRRAVVHFDRIPDQDPAVFSGRGAPEPYRCHEVTRAIADVMGLDENVQDGWYGHVDHSWIWLFPAVDGHMPHGTVILDVYAVGRLPPVQLVTTDRSADHYAAGGAVHSLYRESRPRNDIREDVVQFIIDALKKAER